MGDIFWDFATSYAVLSIIGLVFVTALVISYFPMLKWFPFIGQYVPAARLVVLIAAGLLCFLVGFRVSDGRAEAKTLRSQLQAKETDLKAANDAAEQANAARQELAKQAEADQERITKYEDALKARQDSGCTLTDDDLRWLREPGAGK